MKKPSHDLFLLIKSLTPKEKRYFKLYASLSGKSKRKVYVQLFEAIDKMKKYDEEWLKEKYKGASFMHQLSSNKNYLYHAILKSLCSYYSENSHTFRELDLLKKAEILYKKGLFDACIKVAAAGKKAALQNNEYAIYDLFLNWEIKVKLHTLAPHQSIAILDELCRLYELQLISVRYRKGLFLLNNKTIQYGFYLSEQAIREIHDIYVQYGFSQPLFASSDRIMAHYYYFANNIYYLLTNKPNQRAFFIEKALNNLESQKRFYESNPNFYIGTLVNYCDAMIAIGKMQDATAAFHKMRDYASKLSSDYRVMKSSALVFALCFEICIYNLTDNIPKALALESEVKKVINDHSAIVSKSIVNDLAFVFAYSLFLAGEHNKAIDWLHDIITHYKLRYREDVYISARVLLLLAHYELGNMILISRSCDALLKYLKINNKLEEPLRILLHFLKTSSMTKEKHLAFRELEMMKQRLDKILTQNDYIILKYVDIDCWVDSKINGMSLTALIKRKHAQKKEVAFS